MIEYLMLTLLGCILGTITGLTPGLHVNTVCLLGLILYQRLGLDPLQFSTVMISMAVTQSFLDFIPAIFVGVPEEETALSVLPAHKLFMQGKSLEAVKLTAYGSLIGLTLSLLMVGPALIIIPILYYSIRSFVVYLLIAAIIVLILREKTARRILWSAITFFTAGFFGLTVLNQNIISTTHVLFPVFAGLFGISNILYSLKSKTPKIPQEKHCPMEVDASMVKSGALGCFGGIIVGLMPGMSPSQIGIIIYDIVGSNIRNFLVSVSAINTADAIYSLVALYTINNPRSGVATMIGDVITLDFNTLLVLLGSIAFTGLIATLIHISAGRFVMKFVSRINYELLNSLVVLFVFGLVYWITGLVGTLICIVATCIGLIPILGGISRTHLMAVLILPTVLYFLGG